MPLPSTISDLLASAASAALLAELKSWPKPGLVSHVDSGSHLDMDAGTFKASTAAIAPFFADLAAAGAAGSSVSALRDIGRAAERAMLDATGGVNTHRGAIFGLGLLCAAAGATWSRNPNDAIYRDAGVLTATVRHSWGQAIAGGPIPLHSHGTNALRKYGASGARGEAASGFPLVLKVGLPALQRGRKMAPADPEAARIQAFFALLEAIDDTNVLHRGGRAGRQFAQAAAADFLERGGVAKPGWRERAAVVHRDFIARRLSPGGCADLLAITLFLDTLQARHDEAPMNERVMCVKNIEKRTKGLLAQTS